MRITRVLLALSALIVLTGCGITSVNPGNRAVFATWGKVDPQCYPEGLYFYNPFTQSVYEIDTKIQKLTVSMMKGDDKQQTFGAAASKDLQDVYLNVLTNFRLDGAKCHEVILNVGVDFESRLVVPAIVESAKATTALFNAEEIVQKRAELKRQVFDNLKARLAPHRIDVVDVSIVNIDFNPEYAKAIEQKQVQQQQVQQAEYIRQQREKEGQQHEALAKGVAAAAIAKAEGDAKSTRLRGDAEAYANRVVKESLSGELIRYTQINRWDGKLPHLMGSQVVPFLNIDK